MSGGLMQLVAYGAQDIYLTGNPQITFFKLVYRRHTNFAMEEQEISLNAPNFGQNGTVVIPRSGDLITKVYFLVKIDKVLLSEGSKFGWVRRLGYALLDSVEITIGGSRIDRHFGTWLNIWYELAHHAGDGERGFAKMIGDVPEMTGYNCEDKPEYTLYIPLKFWFNRHVGLALPLIALQYHEVRLDYEFAKVDDLIVANEQFHRCDKKCLRIKDAQLLVKYIFLDTEERRRFAQVGHEYLIEQLQFHEEAVTGNSSRLNLNFNHPTKEFVWVYQNANYVSGKTFPFYSDAAVWDKDVLIEAATKILEESVVLISTQTTLPGPSGEDCVVVPAENECVPKCGEWQEFCPGFSGVTCNGKICVTNESDDKALWINTDSLTICGYSLTDKIYADIKVTKENMVKITNVRTCLTARDLSIPVERLDDTRAFSDDPFVNEFINYGVLIDGTGNPVKDALIQFNGHDRFDRREGSYFNYVIPDEAHTNTPADGVNVYSFALHPEEHQPSGSANLSRIDTVILNINWFDPTAKHGLPDLCLFNNGSQVTVYAVNYNVLRIMSGMGGVAYSS